MGDGLKEIKYAAEECLADHGENGFCEDWDCRTVLKVFTKLKKCQEESAELNRLFKLQHSRTKEAEKMWQEATGNHGTMPDLGVLLEWLMLELENAKGASMGKGACMKAALNQLSIARAEFEYQHRHRKWALHELYKHRSTAEMYDENFQYQHKQAEKFKARVGELLQILEKHGIVC